MIPYNGLSDGMIGMNEKNLFTRELLDMWVWDVCGSSATFRDEYYSWESKSTAFRASYPRIGVPINVSRQLCNDAFTAFLKC